MATLRNLLQHRKDLAAARFPDKAATNVLARWRTGAARRGGGIARHAITMGAIIDAHHHAPAGNCTRQVICYFWPAAQERATEWHRNSAQAACGVWSRT
jgi:hypothetical protein